MAAQTKVRSPGVDRWMRADMTFPDGSTGRIECGMLAFEVPRMSARVEGEGGTLRSSTSPRRSTSTASRSRRPTGRPREKVQGEHTYWYQLGAFVSAVRNGTGNLTPPSDSIANMKVIDDVYRAAGLEPRRPTA